MAENSPREYFTFYKSFEDGIQHLEDTEQLQVYRAISRYSLFGEEPNLSGHTAMAWAFIFPILKKARRNYDNGCKGGEYGYLGGAPKGNQNARKQPQNNPQNNPTYTITDTYTKTRENKKSVARFTPPTLDEVKGYISEKGYTVNADAFYNHYEAIGWKIGKNSMKDWRASVRSWQSRENRASPQQLPATTKRQEYYA